MKKTKINNQEDYERATKKFEEDYFKEFVEAKAGAINPEKFYIKSRNYYNDRLNYLQNKSLINTATIFIEEWIFNNNSKANSKSEFEILQLFCEKNNSNLQALSVAMVEFKAVKKVFGKLLNELQTESDLSNENKLTVKALALKHVYLAMFGGQPVTQQNKNELAKKYNLKSGDKLRNEFTNYQNEDKRMDLITTNRRAANEHLQRFKTIISILEIENTEAYKKAKSDLETLEKHYNKHY